MSLHATSAAALVFVVPFHPVLSSVALVAALRDEIEVVIRGVQDVDATRVRRIRMEDFVLGVPVKDADALAVGVPRVPRSPFAFRTRRAFRKELGRLRPWSRPAGSDGR